MRILLFVPSYNDTAPAYKLSKKMFEYEQIQRALIVDDSDDPESIELSRAIDHEKIDIIRRPRSGKWSAWRIALNRSLEYDGLVEIDSDVEVADLPIISKLESLDVVTAYQDFALPPRRALFSRRIAEIYKTMHGGLRNAGKFNMGGQIIALSHKATSRLVGLRFFEEPVLADDHVISLASRILGLRCATVDCGMMVKLPSTFAEWVKYRSRHRGTIGWAEEYVASKTGKPSWIRETSRRDYNATLRIFLRSLVPPFHPMNPLIVLFFGVSSLLPLEDQFE